MSLRGDRRRFVLTPADIMVEYYRERDNDSMQVFERRLRTRSQVVKKA